MGGGLDSASSRQIKQMRAWMATDAKPLDKVLKSKQFITEFPDGLKKDKILKTLPRHDPPTHKRIEWLRLQAYDVTRPVSRKELYSSELKDLVLENWKQTLRLNEVLYEALADQSLMIDPSNARADASDDDSDDSDGESDGGSKGSPNDLWDDRL
jgi:hypothetical protein